MKHTILHFSDFISGQFLAGVTRKLRGSTLVFVALQSAMMVVVLAGCVTPPKPAPVQVPVVIAEPPPPVKPTALTAEADSALKAAEQTVIETRVKRALWTAANEQLSRARAAAKEFDSELTLKHAREVIALCQASLQQQQSAPVTW